MDKSSRHSKILGNFGENMAANWLSRSGFEVAIIDHSGIDILAYNPKTKERYGITVKSRARENGKEEESVNIFNKKNHDVEKFQDACKAFGAEGWMAIYVENDANYNAGGDLYMTTFANYIRKYHINKNNKIYDWKMNKEYKKKYSFDKSVHQLKIIFDKNHWTF